MCILGLEFPWLGSMKESKVKLWFGFSSLGLGFFLFLLVSDRNGCGCCSSDHKITTYCMLLLLTYIYFPTVKLRVWGRAIISWHNLQSLTRDVGREWTYPFFPGNRAKSIKWWMSNKLLPEKVPSQIKIPTYGPGLTAVKHRANARAVNPTGGILDKHDH